MLGEYLDFLKAKVVIAPDSGFEISEDEINPILKSHQKDSVLWAIRKGRGALFEAFGLGKTIMELEWCRLVVKHEGGQALIILPLGVKQEFTRDAQVLLNMDPPPYVKNMTEVKLHAGPILLTNYERVRDGDIDPKYFTAICLDEASVLRSFGSKTYQTFLPKVQGVPFKLVATATPSPNRYKELIHYAGYLEIMDTGQALTRFFQRDSTKANNLTLYSHKEREFWLWMSSWALFVQKPSDLGYDDTGYDLPAMDVRWHRIEADHNTAGFDRDGQMKLLRDAVLSLQDAAREKRESIDIRIQKAKEIMAEDPDSHYIIWHDLEAERHAIKKAMPEAVEIYGSLDLDTREQRTIEFSEGQYQILATKKELSGSGCNFQKHCHRAIFLGIDYEFNDFIQAIHRIYRFMQLRQVRIDIIYMDSERSIANVLKEKWDNHNSLADKMTDILKKYGLFSTNIAEKLARSIGIERAEIKGDKFRYIHNDCVIETAEMDTNSVDLIHTSIPFGNHYEYSASYNDFGHNEDNKKFFKQMDFLTPQLLRVLKPGRVFACHVKDRVLFGNTTGTGMPTIDPFHVHCIRHYMDHRFQYMGMITVVTDVVRENNQTYRLGWTEQCKDGTKMGVGCPEYVLLFRKLPSDTSTAYADRPVVKSKAAYTRGQWQLDAHAFWRSSGDRYVSREELEAIDTGSLQRIYRQFSRQRVYDYKEHVEMANRLDADKKLPATFMVIAPGSWDMTVWDDINRMRTLNTSQSRKREQMHVCPLQLDIVDRIINRYSAEGETVYDPFGGLGTIPLRALASGRYGIGCELNADYFRDAVGYLQEEEAKQSLPTLFDLLDSPQLVDALVRSNSEASRSAKENIS